MFFEPQAALTHNYKHKIMLFFATSYDRFKCVKSFHYLVVILKFETSYLLNLIIIIYLFSNVLGYEMIQATRAVKKKYFLIFVEFQINIHERCIGTRDAMTRCCCILMLLF